MLSSRARTRAASADCTLETDVVRAECVREQLAQMVAANLAALAAAQDQRVAAEFGENLAARSTRWRRLAGRCVHDDGCDTPGSVRGSLLDGIALGAHRQAVGNILDIGASKDFAFVGEHRRAHREARVGRIRQACSTLRAALERCQPGVGYTRHDQSKDKRVFVVKRRKCSTGTARYRLDLSRLLLSLERTARAKGTPQ